MKTTTIGSFPKLNVPIKESIMEVAGLQLTYGIDVLTDGEPRGDMLEYNLEDKIKDFDTLNECKRHAQTKITIPGPITSGFNKKKIDVPKPTSSLLNPFFKEQKLYQNMSETLIPFVEKALTLADYVQVDEPLYNLLPKHIRVLLRRFLDNFNSDKLVLHVCDSVDKKSFNELVAMNAKVISLAFSEEKDNINVLSRSALEDNEICLGAGIISNVNKEDFSIVSERLKKIKEIVGEENIAFIHPDCGLRNTSVDNVKNILDILCALGSGLKDV